MNGDASGDRLGNILSRRRREEIYLSVQTEESDVCQRRIKWRDAATGASKQSSETEELFEPVIRTVGPSSLSQPT
jgi:hypothetical protein